MNITTLQVAEKLGVSDNVVKRLVRDGHLAPVNQRGEGATKFFMKFDAKAVSEFQRGPWKEMSAKPAGRRVNGHALPASVAPIEHAPVGISARLDRIEQKIDALLRAWS